MSSETPPLSESAPPTAEAVNEKEPLEQAIVYGGFWRRLTAFLLDYIVIMLMIIAFSFGMGIWMAHQGVDASDERTLMIFDALMQIVSLGLGWLYFAGLESSRFQGTLGKQLLGLSVTDLHGQRISFLRATGRHLGKVVSMLVLGVGFLMIGVTPRKRGLHDFLARTLVVYEKD